MKNVTIENIKQIIKRKTEKICEGKTKTSKKFISEMLTGIISCKDVKLSSVGRALKEKTDIKYTEKRLSRNIQNGEYTRRINEIMIQENIGQIDSRDVIAIDFTDISKRWARKMENLEMVYDGSEKKECNGYNILLSGIIKQEEVKPIYVELYSTKERTYKSKFTKVKEMLDRLRQKVKGRFPATIVLDRGFDDKKYYDYFSANKMRYITRLKINRKVILCGNGKKKAVGEIYSYSKRIKCLGEIIYNGKVKQSKLEIGYIPVKFNKESQEEMTIVVIKSEDYSMPMYLITNKKCETAHQATKIYQTYLQRWSVEMIIRFMKEGYNLEDFRVLTYQGIQNLVSITAIVVHIVGKIVYESGNIRIIKNNLIEISRRIKTEGKFLYYSISDGLRILFGELTKKLIVFPSSYMGQYSLFGQYLKNG